MDVRRLSWAAITRHAARSSRSWSSQVSTTNAALIRLAGTQVVAAAIKSWYTAWAADGMISFMSLSPEHTTDARLLPYPPLGPGSQTVYPAQHSHRLTQWPLAYKARPAARCDQIYTERAGHPVPASSRSRARWTSAHQDPCTG